MGRHRHGRVVRVDALAAEFEQHRAHLIGVAYRLTGTRSDAEDAVQDAWLRLARLTERERAEIRELRGWLTTAVGRLCLDRMRSAAGRRERYVGSWLPEPLLSVPGAAPDPLAEVVRADDVRMAALLVLERLTAEQRVAFVLHDAFGLPFTDIAGVLGCTVATARQHASRGRRTVAAADPPPRAPIDEQHRVLERFVAAMATGDVRAVVELLHPDAVVVGDSGGAERTARRPVVGADKVARFLLGLRQRYGPAQLGAASAVLVNGDLGLLFPGSVAGSVGSAPMARRVSCFAVRDGRVAAIYDIVNPAKLSSLDGPRAPVPGTPPPR